MSEPGRLQALADWWRDLSTGWRVNVALYALAGVCLVALLAQIATGGGQRPQKVEVASRPQTGPASTQPQAAIIATTSTVPPTSTAPSTSAAAASKPSGSVRSAQPSPPASRPNTTKGSPTPLIFDPNASRTSVQCQHNSLDPRCGPFSWASPPGGNEPLSISGSASPPTATVGQPVTFTITVRDPDHLVTGNCTGVDYGDGAASNGPCNPAPCPAPYGQWDTPPKQNGSQEFTFQHTYNSPGDYHPTFTFHTDRDRCPDPYGNEGQWATSIHVVGSGG